MRGVGLRRRARHRGARVGDQALDQRDRPRRGGDELARARAQPQAELQHVEGGVRHSATWRARRTRRRRIAARAAARGPRPRRRRPPRRSAIPGGGASRSIAGARCAAMCAGCRTGPSIITSRTSCSVSPTSAMRAVRRAGIRRMAVHQRAHELGAGARLAGAAPAQHAARSSTAPPLAAASGGSWWRCASATKSRSSLARSCGGRLASIAIVRPAFHERLNAARKVVTEFIEVGGHVVIAFGSGWAAACAACRRCRRSSVLVRFMSVRAVRSASSALCGTFLNCARMVSTAASSLSTAARRRRDGVTIHRHPDVGGPPDLAVTRGASAASLKGDGRDCPHPFEGPLARPLG